MVIVVEIGLQQSISQKINYDVPCDVSHVVKNSSDTVMCQTITSLPSNNM